MDWDKISDEFDESDYAEIVARDRSIMLKFSTEATRLLAEALALMICQIADNTGFANHVLGEATNMVEAIENKLRS